MSASSVFSAVYLSAVTDKRLFTPVTVGVAADIFGYNLQAIISQTCIVINKYSENKNTLIYLSQ